MAERVQFQDYTPEVRWFDQMDIPAEFRGLSPEEQAQRLSAVSSYAIAGTAEADAEAEAAERYRLSAAAYLGERMLAGANTMVYNVGTGVEDTIRRVVLS